MLWKTRIFGPYLKKVCDIQGVHKLILQKKRGDSTHQVENFLFRKPGSQFTYPVKNTERLTKVMYKNSDSAWSPNFYK